MKSIDLPTIFSLLVRLSISSILLVCSDLLELSIVLILLVLLSIALILVLGLISELILVFVLIILLMLVLILELGVDNTAGELMDIESGLYSLDISTGF